MTRFTRILSFNQLFIRSRAHPRGSVIWHTYNWTFESEPSSTLIRILALDWQILAANFNVYIIDTLVIRSGVNVNHISYRAIYPAKDWIS